MMKSFYLILWLLLGLGSVHAGELSNDITSLPSAASSAMEETPCIDIAERSHHLGKISLERQYEHAFRVENTGTGVLEIERIIVG